MQPRNALILLGIAIALGIFIFAFERGTRTTEEWEERKRLVFPDFKERKDRTDYVEIIRGDDRLVIVKKDPGGPDEHWQITQPVDYPADGSRIMGLFAAIERAERCEFGPDRWRIDLTPASDLAEYGLDKDKAVRLRISAGKETLVDVLIGARTADEDHVYIAPVTRECAYVVDADVRENATRKVEEFRDKRLVNLKVGEITHLVLHEKGKLLAELGREKDGPWNVISPVSDRADKDKVQEITDKLGSLWVDRFEEDIALGDPDLAEKLEKYGLRPPERSATVTLEVGDKPRQHEILFGKKIKKVEGSRTNWDVYTMLAGTGTVVLVPQDVLSKLDVELDDLRDHRAARFEVSDVKTLKIERPDLALAFRKEEDGWKMVEPSARKAESSAVRDLLDDLADLRVHKFLPADTALVSPIKVTIGFEEPEKPKEEEEKETEEEEEEKKPQEPEIVFFEPGDGKQIKARRGEKGAVFEVPSEILKRLAAKEVRFRDRKILDFSAGDVRRLALVKEGRKVEARREDNEWKYEGEGEFDTSNADNIRWDLSDLKAEELADSVEDDSKLAEYGLAEPYISVEVEVAPDEEKEGEEPAVHVLLIGKEAELEEEEGISRYAVLKGRRLVFVLEKGDLERFEKGLLEEEEEEEKKEPEEGEEEEKKQEPGDEAAE